MTFTSTSLEAIKQAQYGHKNSLNHSIIASCQLQYLTGNSLWLFRQMKKPSNHTLLIVEWGEVQDIPLYGLVCVKGGTLNAS